MTRKELLEKAKPILFNTAMVQAVLGGRKTVTRRVVKPQPTYSPRDGFTWKGGAYGTDLPPTIKGAAYNFLCAAPFKKGDYLYVRETWAVPYNENTGYAYKASCCTDAMQFFKWKPSIHMPKEAARLFLKITDVRVERLQDMQSVDAFKEGVRKSDGLYGDMMGFYKLWNSTIKKADLDKYGWKANPWVWVIEFEKVEAQSMEEKDLRMREKTALFNDTNSTNKLPNGLRLFVADVVDEDSGHQEYWFFVGETHDLTFNRFIEWANERWEVYAYHFYEANDEDVKEFIERFEDTNFKDGFKMFHDRSLNWNIVEVHIDTIKVGDIILCEDGIMRTVGKEYIKRDGFMGTSIFGDSYHSGYKKVKKVVVPAVNNEKGE